MIHILNIIAWGFIALMFLTMLWLGFLMATAPYGYEDEDGYHETDPPDSEVVARIKRYTA